MFQILNWDFKHAANEPDNSHSRINTLTSGIRHDAVMLKKFDHSLVKVGPVFSYIACNACLILSLVTLLLYGTCSQGLLGMMF